MASVRSRRRKGGTFWFVVDRVGRERSKGSGKAGEKAARRHQARLETAEWAERRGEPVEDALGSSWTLQTLRDRDLAAKAAQPSYPSRRRRWGVLLTYFSAGTTLDRVPALIQGFLNERLRTVTAQTVRNDLSLLSSAWKFARRMRHESGITIDPFQDLERPRVTGSRETLALPDQEARKVIAAAWAKARTAPAHLADLWRDNAAIVELCYETSSRISQVLTLRRDQVRNGLLRFPPHKGGIPREFPVKGAIARVLKRLPDRGMYFFPARLGAVKKAHRDNLAGFWRAIAPAGFTPHGLRHSAATAAIYAGESLPDVANRLGHKDLTMVQRLYGHIFRTPIRPLPRAGSKTAEHSGLERRPRAVEKGKKGIPSKPGKRLPISPSRVSPVSAPR